MNSISKMWLWLGLCFASAVVAQDIIQPSIAKEISEKHCNCGNEEVLFKIWAILSNLLDKDGKTVKVPIRDNIEYALTLIKKSVLENTDNQNLDVLQKLLLSEAELAKHKGILLNDNRPLKTLLEKELFPNDQNSKVMFKYELRTNDKPGCRQAFEKVIQKSHEDYAKLAKSPICSDDNIWLPTLNPISLIDVNSPLYNNIYNPVKNNFQKEVNGEYGNNPGTVLSNNAGYPNELIRNVPVFPEVNSMMEDKDRSAELNILNKTIPLQVAELTKDPNYLPGNNFTADLEYAKSVADKISKLYQIDTTESSQSFKIDVTTEHPLDNDLGIVNFGTVNNQPSMPSFLSKPTIQTSYQNSNLNSYKLSPYGILSPVTESYTKTTDGIQTNIPQPNTIVNQGYVNPQNVLTNSKYYPNPYQNYLETYKILQSNIPVGNYGNELYQSNVIPKNENLLYKYFTYPYQNKGIVTKTPVTGINLQNSAPNILNYNIYSSSKPYNADSFKLQYNYPYQQKVGNNPLSMNLNYYPTNQRFPETFKSRPTYGTGSNFYGFHQLLVNPQSNALSAINKYSNLNNPATAENQQIIQNVNAPQPDKKNLNKPYIQNFRYSRLSHVQNPNVPEHFAHQAANHNNNRPVIDTLVNWISGTNPAKLNSSNESDKTEIELTYLVKKPPPVTYQPTTYFIKFRLPYKAFVKHFTDFFNQANLRSSDNDLYQDLASRFNATVIKADMPQVPEEDKTNLEDNHLIRARLIEPNSDKADNSKSIDIVNLVKQTKMKNTNVGNNAVVNVGIPL